MSFRHGWGWYSSHRNASYIHIRYKQRLSHWYAVSRAYGCTLVTLHWPSWPQILEFGVACGVKMMALHHGWGRYLPSTASYIHIRCIKSVWAIGTLSQGHMGTPSSLLLHTGQLAKDMGKSGSLVEWICFNMSCLRLIFTSDSYMHQY